MATIFGTNSRDLLQGTEDADLITGLNGRDTLLGNGGDDQIFGDRGRDLLDGGNGNDTLIGGRGNDTLVGSNNNDLLNGEGGVDTADYSELGQTVTLLATGVVNKGNAGIDQLLNIETIIGATGFDNTIDGITGSGNITSFDIDLSANNLIVQGIPGLGDVTFTIENFVNVIGTNQNDRIVGNNLDNTIMGSDGDDFIVASAGNDLFDGGGGVDTIDYTDLGQPITIFADRLEKGGGLGTDRPMLPGTTEILIGNPDFVNVVDVSGDSAFEIDLTAERFDNPDFPGFLIIKNFVNVIGSNKGDKIVGNELDNQLDGGRGRDTIVGGSGMDILTGGGGRDTFVLGEANNIFYLGEDNAEITDFNANRDTIQLAVSIDTYSFFENPVSGIVSIAVDDGDDVFNAGDDLIAQVNISRGTFSTADNLIFA